MAILSLALYGSRARNDFVATSDTDLFAITDDPIYEMMFSGATNIACYPLDLALSRAKEGDLFFYHLTLESVTMYDPVGYMDQLKAAFVKKDSYRREKKHAVELGFALLSNIGMHTNYFYINKRLAWCFRTILIAKSAEEGVPVFSAKQLAERFKDKDIELLLATKKAKGYLPEVYNLMREKLQRYGAQGESTVPMDILAQLQYFTEQENTMGVKTIETIMKRADEESYC